MWGSFIDELASMVTGLKNIGGKLFFNGNFVNSVPLHHALLAFPEFMNNTPNPTVLVAHNASFDTPRLFRAISKDLLDTTSHGDFHEALYDVQILEQIITSLEIKKKDL